jgi:hypothetical protein
LTATNPTGVTFAETTTNDPAALHRAFDGLNRWGMVRAVFQILAFGANLRALVSVLRSKSSPTRGVLAPTALRHTFGAESQEFGSYFVWRKK